MDDDDDIELDFAPRQFEDREARNLQSEIEVEIILEEESHEPVHFSEEEALKIGQVAF